MHMHQQDSLLISTIREASCAVFEVPSVKLNYWPTKQTTHIGYRSASNLPQGSTATASPRAVFIRLAPPTSTEQDLHFDQNSEVAVRFALPQTWCDDRYAAQAYRAERECRALRRLQGSGVAPELVEVFHPKGRPDAGEEWRDEGWMVVMENVEGRKLASWTEVFLHFSAISHALAVLHGHRFLHGDLSPKRFILHRDGQVRLLGLGHAIEHVGEEGAGDHMLDFVRRMVCGFASERVRTVQASPAAAPPPAYNSPEKSRLALLKEAGSVSIWHKEGEREAEISPRIPDRRGWARLSFDFDPLAEGTTAYADLRIAGVVIKLATSFLREEPVLHESRVLSLLAACSMGIAPKPYGCFELQPQRVADNGNTYSHAWMADPGHVLAMERLPGRAASTWLDLLCHFDAAIAVMTKLHQAGFVHGELIPSHFLLQRDGSFKLVSLGKARRIDTSAEAEEEEFALRADIVWQLAAHKLGRE